MGTGGVCVKRTGPFLRTCIVHTSRPAVIVARVLAFRGWASSRRNFWSAWSMKSMDDTVRPSSRKAWIATSTWNSASDSWAIAAMYGSSHDPVRVAYSL